ncbi:hypothetical protein Pint_22176 [Pistacia integerrima]|uniref:Uncharacterized protein n=1 Tax=Pistacia integerrima TaxID=434235 RepID=A0ACC0YIR0_9ROSI|nr:hypothetical protein Pint_22176 [Pistacia integerrima]
MDKGLLDEKGEEERREEVSSVGNGRNMGAGEYVEEVKRLSCIAGPMVAVYLSQDFLQVISVMMVGHLGKLSLSSTAVAISFCAVTGFSLLFGMSTAMETLCGQGFGAQQYRKLGIQTHTAMFSLILVCFPVSILWINMGKLLNLMGQDPLISTESGKFTVWLVPALFGYAALQPLVRYFQVQSLITPLLMSSCVTICFHIFISWALILEFELNNIGAALAIGMSFWLNVLLLGLYMMYSSSCEKTRVPVSMELFRGLGEFFRLAIPSAFMVCTRVSNALGAGNPQAARVAVRTAVFLTVLETVIVSSILYASRHVFGYLFSNDKEVVDYVTTMAPLICLCVMLNGFQAVLSGIARACGWQDLGAYVNLVAYYLCGIPVAAILGFWLQLRGQGLWIGIQVGAFVQSVLLAILTSCQNWEKQAVKARERIFEGRSSADNEQFSVN